MTRAHKFTLGIKPGVSPGHNCGSKRGGSLVDGESAHSVKDRASAGERNAEKRRDGAVVIANCANEYCCDKDISGRIWVET